MPFVLYSLTRNRTVAKSHGERSLPLMAILFLRTDEQNKKNMLKSHSQERGKEPVLLSPCLMNEIKTPVKQRGS